MNYSFDHSALEETNKALYYDYFMFYVTIPAHINMHFDIFQSTAPKLSTSFWLAYELPSLSWGDTSPVIEKSPLKFDRALSSRVNN